MRLLISYLLLGLVSFIYGVVMGIHGFFFWDSIFYWTIELIIIDVFILGVLIGHFSDDIGTSEVNNG